jgi:arsenite methyltransferase
VSGALAERVFANKIRQAGFVDLSIGDRRDMGVDDVALYPLFTAEVIRLMRELIPADRQHRVATSVLARARKPA